MKSSNHKLSLHRPTSNPSSTTLLFPWSLGTQVKSIKSRSHSYVTTDGRSASLSWCQAPIWGLRQDFYYCRTFAGLLIWDALSDERTGLPFTIAAGPRQGSRTRNHILLSQIRDSHNLEGQVPVFISHRNRVPQLYSQALGSLIVASYDSQGYGGVIRTHFHAGFSWNKFSFPYSLISSRHGPRTENTPSIVAWRRSHRKHVSHVRLRVDLPVSNTGHGEDDIENIASSIVASWTVFTELLPGKSLIKSVAVI
jgi:hypothetical protein